MRPPATRGSIPSRRSSSRSWSSRCCGGSSADRLRTFQTKPLPPDPDAVAPDGSHVRILLQVRGGGLAHFELAPGHTSLAVRHRTVEEIWYFLSGTGEMWRASGDSGDVVAVSTGVCITIPLCPAVQ